MSGLLCKTYYTGTCHSTGFATGQPQMGEPTLPQTSAGALLSSSSPSPHHPGPKTTLKQPRSPGKGKKDKEKKKKTKSSETSRPPVYWVTQWAHRASSTSARLCTARGGGQGAASDPATRRGAAAGRRGRGRARRGGGGGRGAAPTAGAPSEPEGGFGERVLHLEARQEALQGRGQGVEEGRREAGEKEIISSDL